MPFSVRTVPILLLGVLAACNDFEKPVVITPPGGLTITPRLRSLAVGDTFRLSSVITGTSTAPSSPAWNTGNALIATVDTAGLVKAVGVGIAHITVASPTANDTLTLTVTAGFGSVIAGDSLDCAIDMTGAASCWPVGTLGNSQLATGTPVLGGHTFTSLSAGFRYICGIAADSAGYCWGENRYGAFGDGDTTWSAWTPTPTAVAGGHKLTAISAGIGIDVFFPLEPLGLRSCAVAAGGAPYCWGYGNLGIAPDNASSAVPHAVSGGLSGQSIAVGLRGACLVTTAHAIECWGDNSLGQLAAVTDTAIAIPAAVSAPTTFTDVAAGEPDCALGANGVTYCWGEIDYDAVLYGELPVARGGPTLTALSGTDGNACGVTGAGAAYCLGDNEAGQVGNGQVWSDGIALDPTAVIGGVAFRQVAAGSFFTCGVALDSSAYCWGDPGGGELGNGAVAGPSIASPALVLGGHKFVQVAAGGDYVCGIADSGALLCWGVQNGVRDSLPTPVDTSRSYTQLAVGIGLDGQTECALAADSSTYCWGSGFYGQLGNGSSGAAAVSTVPVLVSGGHRFIQVTVGNDHACGLVNGGTAYCWGRGIFGALGTGDTTSSAVPVAVTGGHAFAKISAGIDHTCGITTAGALYCWGHNDEYQLGLGYSGKNAATPIPAGGSVQAQVVSAGNSFFCALGTDQLAYCWGYNQQGQLGRGDSTFTHSTPAPAAGGHQLTSLTSNGEESCGLTSSGQVYCWGNNTFSPQPQQGASRFLSISVGTGGGHVCGVTSAREVFCWNTPVPPAPPKRPAGVRRGLTSLRR